MRKPRPPYRPALRVALAVASLSVALPVAPPAAAQERTSALWGEAGEAWDPAGRLPDFSFAGYHGGDREPPRPAATASVRDFGAVGDGRTDDTDAFERALAEMEPGVLLVPAGRYVLTRPLVVDRPGVVIRGEGMERTLLLIPKSLMEIDPRKAKMDRGEMKSPYAFSGAFISLKGKDVGERVARLREPVARGGTTLVLDGPATGIAAGDRVRLRTDYSVELGRALLLGSTEPGTDTGSNGRSSATHVTRVIAVDGDTLQIDRPLPFPIELAWNPSVWTVKPTITESGVEDLAFVFAGRPKRKHLLEEGFNAIRLENVADCWVRGVGFVDADNGVTVLGSTGVLLDGLRFRADRRSAAGGAKTGHHAIWLSGGTQNTLSRGFVFDTVFRHDLTVEGFASGNVFRDGRGVDLSLDHHGNLPFANLFTDLDLGSGRSLWQSGGRGDRLPHTALGSTFWNLRQGGGQAPPIPPRWPGLNLVGVQGLGPDAELPPTDWLEWFDGPPVPADLYLSQRARRGAPVPTAD